MGKGTISSIFLQTQLNSIVVKRIGPSYLAWVSRLTKQEQLVLCIILGLLLTGWAVKTYRQAHPSTQAAEQHEP